MEVTVAVLADYANVSADGKLNIMGIFQEVNPPVLPYALPQMYLVLSFSAGPAEFGTARDVRIVLLHSDGKEVLRLDAQMQVPSANRPGSRAYINEAIGLAGVVFERPGDYGFSILVGDDEKAAVPLHVNKPTQEEVDAAAPSEPVNVLWKASGKGHLVGERPKTLADRLEEAYRDDKLEPQEREFLDLTREHFSRLDDE